jgi:hypothetical protein
MAVRDARTIVGFLDDMDEITADGTEGGIFLLALGVLAFGAAERGAPPATRRARLAGPSD